MFACISIQNFIKIFHAVQELYAFLLTVNGRTDSHSDYSANLRVVQYYLFPRCMLKSDRTMLKETTFTCEPSARHLAASDISSIKDVLQCICIKQQQIPCIFHIKV